MLEKQPLQKGLARVFQKKDHKVRYVYCQYFAKLLYPIKYLAKLTVMRNTNEFKNYNEYNRTKQQTSQRHPFFAGIYTFVWLLDYMIQVFFKISLNLFLGRRLIIDRYIFDIAVNLSLTAGKDVGYSKKLIDWFLKFSPNPDRVLFIDLPESIALKRKNDIQDIAYLKERRQRYLWLAKTYGFTVLDGTRSKDKILDDAIAALNMKDMNKKTILYVHANNRDIGGADYCLFKLASELNKKKFRAVVILSQKTEILDLYEKEGIKTYVIDMERIKKSINPFYLLKLLIKSIFTLQTLRKIIRNEQVDLVHGNDLLDIYGPAAAFLEKKPATQYVRWILESPVWLKKMITSVVYRLNTCVMTVSDAVAAKMFTTGDCVRDRVVTCYDWIDMAKVGHKRSDSHIRSEYGFSNSSPLVGCVGRLEYWKGQDVFIKAAAIVHRQVPDARFLVVGGEVEGRGRESFGQTCRNLSKELGIEDQVIFTGHRKDISHIMESLDVFVHASVNPDPLPGVVMEAMASTTPVVGANAGGVPEEMADRVTGFLYPPDDSKTMAQKIIRLLKDPQLAKQMGRAGQKRVSTLFEKKHLCKKIETVYETIIHTYHSKDRKNKTASLKTGIANLAVKGNHHVKNI